MYWSQFMRVLITTIFACSLNFYCFSQNSNCDSLLYVVTQFDSKKLESKLDSAFNSIPNKLFVSFMEGFNDSVFVYVNYKIIFADFLKTNESIGSTNLILPIPFQSSNDIIYLTIRFRNERKYIKEKLDLQFKHLEVRKIFRWYFIYSNQFPLAE